MSELLTRRIPGHVWVRAGVKRRTAEFEPGHGWLYMGIIRRDAWAFGPVAVYVLRMPRRLGCGDRSRFAAGDA